MSDESRLEILSAAAQRGSARVRVRVRGRARESKGEQGRRPTLTSLTRACTPLSAFMPFTSLKVTSSPSSNSSRSSSTHVTNAGFSLLMDAMMPLCGSSPALGQPRTQGPGENRYIRCHRALLNK